VISSSQRPPPDNTQHSQQTNIHAPGGIRNHNLSRRAAADLRLGDRAAAGKGWINNTSANYKARTKTHMRHKTITNTRKRNNKQIQNQYENNIINEVLLQRKRKSFKESNRPKSITEWHRLALYLLQWSKCPILAKEQYIKWHDRVCAQLHFNICKETGVQLDKKHWYEHLPESVETSQGGKVLWNQQIQPDRTIPNNKPDIIIRDNENGTCMLIDVAISGDRNVI